MKTFKEFICEEMMPYAQTEKSFVGVDNGPVRDNINIHLSAITAKSYATPYHAMEMVRKVLAPFHIFPPSTNFLDGNSGHEVFEISQFGNKMGMTDDGKVVVKNNSPYYIYFEYAMTDTGSFDIFCEIVDEEELDDILADVEDDIEGEDTTTGDGEDAEDSFDSYKAKNQQVNEEAINELSSDKISNYLKDLKYAKKKSKRILAKKMAMEKLLKKDGYSKGNVKVAATEEVEPLEEVSKDLARKAEDKAAAGFYDAYDEVARLRKKAIRTKNPEHMKDAKEAEKKLRKYGRQAAKFQSYADKKS